jgi:alpha-1,3-rhamnosyltransferase
MFQNLPLVSVVIPCYNHEKFVAQAIKSVINQTYRRIQLIVVNDGSTDNSVEVIESMRKKYRFEFIIQENKGYSAAINKGMRDYVEGKYVAYLDSDDYWDVSKIEKQVQFMEENPQYGMCYAKHYIVEGNNISKALYKHNSFFGKSGWLFNYIFLENFIPSLTVMVRKEVYDKVGLYDEQLYVIDYDMWLRIAKQYQIGFIDEYLAY